MAEANPKDLQEKRNQIITAFQQVKKKLIESKYVDREALANAIEKLTWKRDLELRRIGYSYPYELGESAKWEPWPKL